VTSPDTQDLRIGVLFAGQGSQVPSMGRSLAREHPSARDVYARAENALGFDLLRAGDDIHGEFDRGEVVQPALLAYGAAAWATMASAGLRTDAVAGHSLGEMAALVCAEALDLEEALQLAQLRGRLMARCRAGRMAVVFGLDADVVADVCASVPVGEVVVANRNSREQCVVSGDLLAVETAARALAAQGGVVKALSVEVAAHSPLMKPAEAEFAAAVERSGVQAPRVAVISSLTGMPFVDADEVRQTLTAALTRCVDWPRSVRGVLASGAEALVEAGPKCVLRDLVLADQPATRALSFGAPGGLAQLLRQLRSISLDSASPEPARPGLEESLRVLQALSRVSVGTRSRRSLSVIVFEEQVRQPYVVLQAELDQARATGIAVTSSAIATMAHATVSALTVKGLDLLEAQAFVDDALAALGSRPATCPPNSEGGTA